VKAGSLLMMNSKLKSSSVSCMTSSLATQINMFSKQIVLGPLPQEPMVTVPITYTNFHFTPFTRPADKLAIFLNAAGEKSRSLVLQPTQRSTTAAVTVLPLTGHKKSYQLD
jgi:hypothetical protein